jgi:sulfur relay protein TusB/DsrH
MILIIKSGPETTEGKRAVKLARDMAGDIVLIQNAVYFAEKERLEGFCGTAYVLKDDAALRGVNDIKKGIKIIEYPELIDLMAEEKTIGAF